MLMRGPRVVWAFLPRPLSHRCRRSPGAIGQVLRCCLRYVPTEFGNASVRFIAFEIPDTRMLR
jgi:hypothetical protein